MLVPVYNTVGVYAMPATHRPDGLFEQITYIARPNGTVDRGRHVYSEENQNTGQGPIQRPRTVDITTTFVGLLGKPVVRHVEGQEEPVMDFKYSALAIQEPAYELKKIGQ